VTGVARSLPISRESVVFPVREIEEERGVIKALDCATWAAEADQAGEERLNKVLTIQCEPVSSPEPLKLKIPA
jgi:hypothetical protein